MSAVLELDVREWLEEQEAVADELGGGGTAIVPSHARLRGGCRRGPAGGGHTFFCLFPFSLVPVTSSSDRPGRGAKGSLRCSATARTAVGKRTVHILAMISLGRVRVMSKPK